MPSACNLVLFDRSQRDISAFGMDRAISPQNTLALLALWLLGREAASRHRSLRVCDRTSALPKHPANKKAIKNALNSCRLRNVPTNKPCLLPRCVLFVVAKSHGIDVSKLLSAKSDHIGCRRCEAVAYAACW
jgi:hypothetical protein